MFDTERGSLERTKIEAPGVFNLRDLGGMPCTGGQIRPGVFIRSSEWTFATSAGQQALASLGLTHVVDLRSDGERQWRADPVIPGLMKVPIDVVGNHHAVSRLAVVLLEAASDEATDSFHLEPRLANPSLAMRELGEGKARERFLASYRAFCDAERARQALRQVVHLITEESKVGIHCAAGKDRTGWAVASILWYLGVSWDAVLADYLKSNELLGDAISRVLQRFAEAGGDPGLIEPMLVVSEDYLNAFRLQVQESFGSITSYVEVGLGLGPTGGAALRSALTES